MCYTVLVKERDVCAQNCKLFSIVPWRHLTLPQAILLNCVADTFPGQGSCLLKDHQVEDITEQSEDINFDSFSTAGPVAQNNAFSTQTCPLHLQPISLVTWQKERLKDGEGQATSTDKLDMQRNEMTGSALSSIVWKADKLPALRMWEIRLRQEHLRIVF